ncbi:MAG: hypothetical protein ACRDHF_17160 [Tepidiformaceae bacterium]
MRHHVLLLVAFAALPVACGGSNDAPGIEGSPESALGQVLTMVSKEQWGREWESLHPDQQTLVARGKFVSCSKGADSVRITSLKVLDVSDEEADIPGTGNRAASKAVTAEYGLMEGSQRGTSVDTFYLFDVDGRWRWVLPKASVEAYKAGSCPA